MDRRSADATRELLVAAALEALRDLRAEDLITAVGTREIARRAGVSAASVFHHFGSVEGLGKAVVASVFDVEATLAAMINVKLSTIIDARRPTSAAIEMHRSEFERLADDPGHRLRIGLWAFGGDQARVAYGDYNRTLDGVLAQKTTDLLDSWGREMRPPYDVSTLIAAHSALVTGSVIRHVGDPAAIDPDRFGMIAAALTLVMLRGKGDTRGLGDRLTEMDRFTVREPVGRASSQRLRTRSRILHAAQVVFERFGYEDATVGDIAREAHVAPTTVYGLVEGKSDLAVALLLESASHLDEPSADLKAELELMADFAAAHTDYLTPYTARLASGATADPDPLLARAVHIFDTAREHAGFVHDLTSAELGRTVVLILASRILLAPADGSAAAVRHVQALLGC